MYRLHNLHNVTYLFNKHDKRTQHTILRLKMRCKNEWIQYVNIQRQWRRLYRARGHREYTNSKQETDWTVLTITKALTKTTNCAFRAKKWRGTTKKNVFRRETVPTAFALDLCPPPHFKFVSAPLYRNYQKYERVDADGNRTSLCL